MRNFSSSIEKYFMSERSERVKYFFQHEKRNFVSPSDHVMFCLLYKHHWNAKPFYLNSFLVWKVRFIMKPKQRWYVKISSFRAKAHLIFHWCLYNSRVYKSQFFFQQNQKKERELLTKVACLFCLFTFVYIVVENVFWSFCRKWGWERHLDF